MKNALPPLSPNYATQRNRAYRESVEVHGKWPVEFQFRPAQGDHPHLLVVFSSVGSKYGFGNALESVKCNILRIRDHFDGGASYYVARNMDFSVTDSIQALIEDHMRRLRVTRDEVTLLGASKGGSAALYYGLKYDYKNIVASTPQYFLGSYSKGHGQLGDAVLGEGQSEENVATMDAVMKDVLAQRSDLKRNIYVVSSPGDYQYEQEVEHYLPALREYENFNFLFVESPTVRRHDEVVRQALPSILSIVYSLTEGAAPRWGEVRIGTDSEDPEAAAEHLAGLRERDTALATLRSAEFADGCLQLKGHAFLPGVSPDGPAVETKQLVLEKDGETWTYPLESTKEIRLYRDYFDEYFCEYAMGGFASQGELAFTGLPQGTYDVSVCITSEDEGIERRTRLISQNAVDRRQACGDSELLFRGGKGGLKLVKRSIVGIDSAGVCFSAGKAEERDQKIHAEGVLFLPGRNADRDAHAFYYLVLQGRQECHSFPLGVKKNPDVVRPHKPAGDLGNYDFGYFTTGTGGIDVSGVPAGKYTLLVSMSVGGALFTKKAGKVTLKKPR
ncbi:accessory Sec system protein Asp2 [Streptomyces sp. NPDC059861]|uniref:accessory Sec system protein Asp2 n=1 Tax=Streptomyces sp. NPDC059861 TaxID=3346974 RepID=UPI003649A0DF